MTYAQVDTMSAAGTAAKYPGITYVIPCGGEKLDRAAPARDLYTGRMFCYALAKVSACAAGDERDGRGPARVLILSALHGLVELDTVLEPYDMKMGAPGSVDAATLAAQAYALGIDGWTEDGPGSEVYTFLPRAYFDRLDEALRTLDVYAQNVYEACRGIGEQRRVLAHVGTIEIPKLPEGPGPIVWVGTDTAGFGWRLPHLVSYGRLREAHTMPVATAPWVCDSRGFKEVMEHGEWTISAGQYAADLRRYVTEIGHLTWAAPQDWPAARAVLDRTGLTEAEHQARTIASVIELRELLGDKVPVICVVTGETLAGYLRHIDMYAAAGIDLRAEAHVVGIGALVDRTPTEAADILRTLYAAGLHRMHGFGVKGVTLDLLGDLLESIDSASWSSGARHRTGRCPHGVTEWEQNCPVAAFVWAMEQRARALAAPVQEVLDVFGAASVSSVRAVP